VNCLDCLDEQSLLTPAVAVCTACGAAVCREHTVLTARRLARTGAMGRQDPVEPAARTARCRTCQTAVDATTLLPAEPLRLWPRTRGDR